MQIWDVMNTEESLVTILMKHSELRDPLGGPMAEQGPLAHSISRAYRLAYSTADLTPKNNRYTRLAA